MRLALALAALCLLTACDSGSDEGPDALVGTWDTQSGTSEVFLTVSQTQSLYDLASPGAGGIAVSGAVTGTLTYGTVVPNNGQLTLFLSDGALFTDNLRLGLSVTTSAASQSLRLSDVATDRSFRRQNVPAPFPVTSTGTAITVAATTLTDANSGATVTVSGQLTPARIQAVAGQETRLSSTTTTRADASVLSVTFEQDGVFRRVREDLTTETGTWADLGGGQVRVRIGTSDPETYTYERRG